MIAGTQLAGQRIAKAAPLPSNCNHNQVAWHKVGSPARIIATLRAAIKARVPVGYEDETGFHYSMKASAWPAAGFPVRIIAKLRAAIEARVPVGYEDETGFHYSMKASDWIFSI
jgi:hypothetical protein